MGTEKKGKELMPNSVTITEENNVFTLINVFTVKPDTQQEVIDGIVRDNKATMSRIPGYISSTIHKNREGTRVVNYVQWQNREVFEAMLKNPAAIRHMESIRSIIEKEEPLAYEVVSIVRTYEEATPPVQNNA